LYFWLSIINKTCIKSASQACSSGFVDVSASDLPEGNKRK
jgi:hypothetical protein